MSKISVCPKCNGLGWIVKGKGVQKCECKYKDITENIYKRMNIPRRYKDKDFSNFLTILTEHKILLKILDEYTSSELYKEGKGIYLYGAHGVGKTHLAVGILKQFFKKKKIVGLFYDTRNLLFDLKSTFDGSGSGREILEEVVKTPILVLDDLGSERLSDWAKDILRYIIIKRYNDLLPVIITSNFKIKLSSKGSKDGTTIFSDTVEERMGKSVASRLLEMCEMYEVIGEDMRNSDTVLKELNIKDNKSEKSRRNRKSN